MIAAPRVSDAAAWCGGTYHGPDAELFRTWRSDSREVCPGDAFVALSGESSNGHHFVDNAVKRGASVLLIDEAHAGNLGLERGEFTGVAVIIASDTAAALAQIAGKYLQAFAPTVIGITGSVGKTTTRELTACVLRSKYNVHSAVRSFNTVIGCGLTILAMPPETEVLILEYGTNHFGEISEMVSYFPPEFAVITEVAPAHLEGFGDIAGVLRAKLEIYCKDKLKCFVFNADNELLSAAVGDSLCSDKIGVGFSSAAVKILGVSVRLEEGIARTSAAYDLMGEYVTAVTAVFGYQHAYNIGFALAAGKYFGVDTAKAVESLADFKPLSGRGVIKKINNTAWVIDEAYNASPRSMEAAILNVMDVSAKSRDYDIYAILGGMREMGESSPLWHQKIADNLNGFKEVFLYGEEWKDDCVRLPQNAVYCENMEELMRLALSMKMENAVVLVKGSNSYGLKKIVALLTEGANVY